MTLCVLAVNCWGMKTHVFVYWEVCAYYKHFPYLLAFLLAAAVQNQGKPKLTIILCHVIRTWVPVVARTNQARGAGVVCLADYFCLGLGFFLFLKFVMAVHSVPIQSNNLSYHSVALLPGLHKGLQPGSRQGCPPTALDSSRKLLRKGAKVWSEGAGGVVRVVALCIVQQQPLVGPALSPQRGHFYVGYCCYLSPSLFRLCWVSFSKLTHLTLRVHLSPPSYAINSLLSCIVRCWH